MGMGRSFHHWGAREQFLWGWGGCSTTGERGSSSYGDGEVVPPLGSEGTVLMGMGRSFHHEGVREQFLWGWGGQFHHWGAREQFLWGWGGCSYHKGAREQFLWGWGGRSTTGERGNSYLWGWGGRSTTRERESSSYGNGEVIPPLGSEGAVLMGMGRSFHHWGAREQFLWGWGGRSTTEGAREQFLWGWGGRSTTGERGSSSYGDGEVVPPLGSEGAVLMGMGRSFHH